ncbi:hypothetical protein NCAS_0C02710 [Naumovozyma castellii]|uniref:U3 small nucleolar RNA-associated protein 13 C-terminal domain-containing protein n=1 Tax=Naumovozyma castellii TaxID=27288 RepID=G0VCQ1_NAUCA|nr:hypothetical protein NCAS_0C02710 [Naumovozyma castellii CBS 4309]CCC69261.1 hypothetical protein NCAS_0C02710 [Naumovozyma castellii CBS 4309]
MDLKTSYQSTTLRPIYAGSSAIATVSADGTVLATPILDDIEIISLTTPQRRLHSIANDDEQEITALKLTPDAQYLSFISQNQLLKIFKLDQEKKDQGKIIRSMKMSSPCYIMDCDSTSTLVALGGTDGSITVVDIENGFITHSLKGHGATISALKFFGQANSNVWLLCSGDTNGMVKVWDLVKRKCLHTMQEHSNAVRGLDVREVGDEWQLISGGRDNVCTLWNFNLKKKCTLLKTIPVHQQVESCGFINHEHDDLIYTAGGDALLQFISLEKATMIKKTKKHIEELFIIGVLPILENDKMYLVMSDQTLELVDIKSNLLNESSDIIEIESCIAGNNGTIADMKFVGPNHDKLALATNSPTLRIIPVPSSEQEELPINVEMYEGHEDLLNSLDTTDDGLWMATASKDHTAIVWKYNSIINKFQPYVKFIGHSATVTAVGLPNVMLRGYPEFLLTASNDLTIKKWKIPKPSTTVEEDCQIVKVSEYTRRAHEKDINALAISPNDSIFATASYDKTCKIWDLENGELTATLSNHKRGLWDVAFCQYDKLIATCSGDKTIKIWSLDTFSVMKTLEGHTNAVQRCMFINKQLQLVSSGADGLIKIWDCSTGDCLKTLDGHDNRIWALTEINDGDMIVSADADGVFQFWKDCTELEKEQNLELEKEKVEKEQTLKNYLLNEDWTNAFLLALTLDHPMRVFNVLKQSLNARKAGSEEQGKITIFNEELDNVIGTLDNEKLLLLLKRCRDWNTNARSHKIAQCTIRCILLTHNIAELSGIPGLVQTIESIIPYTQRHFTRVDNLVEQSYILDYALVEMDKLI